MKENESYISRCIPDGLNSAMTFGFDYHPRLNQKKSGRGGWNTSSKAA
jgi:hypothetical protein